MPQPCTYSSAQEAGQRERGRRTCQRNGHQLLKATVAGDGVDINDERWRPHVAQCDNRNREAREAQHARPDEMRAVLARAGVINKLLPGGWPPNLLKSATWRGSPSNIYNEIAYYRK